MKKIMLPLLVYLVVCAVGVLGPASDGYDSIGWKLLMAQIYAIPLLISAITVSYVMNKKRSANQPK